MTDGDSPPETNPRRPAPTGSVKVAIGVLLAALLAFAASYHFRRAPKGQPVLREANALSDRLRSRQRGRWADEISAECAKDACSGAERAALRGLDADLSKEVLSLLNLAAKHCPERRSLPGLRAEALTRAGQVEAGAREADGVLRTAPRDAHALYARALAQWRRNRSPEALALAQRAIESGRGASAYLLKGLIAYGSNQLESAEASFRSMLEFDPDDVEGVYDLALVHQRQNRYRLAREGYLRVLRLEPARTDARHNLAILAHSIGANDEARHHLVKLRATSKDAAQINKLEALLATPAQGARPSASSPNFSMVRGASSAKPAPAPAGAASPALVAP